MPPGGGRADPYRVWLSEIMLQQTTVAAVKAYFERFTDLWPRVGDLAAADDGRVMAEWAGLGYYARARNLLACARLVTESGGFPTTRAELERLPGVGPYTSAAISAIAYDLPETVVDGNVERVVARLFAVQTPMPTAKKELIALATTLTPRQRAGDYAQAMMDLGATICTPRRPACAICPINDRCDGRAACIAGQLPRKIAKIAKPQRHGVAWVAIDNGRVLLERRPPKGLLGGTLAFPSTGWDGSDVGPPAAGEWRDMGQISHVFTHFSLQMQVLLANPASAPDRGQWVDLAGFDPADLPGLMRKVWGRINWQE